MDICVTLLEDLKKNTIKELNKKGLVVVDSQGNEVRNAEKLMGDWTKVNRRRTALPEQQFECNARIWNDGYGAKCSKIKLPNSDFCAQHQGHIDKHNRLIYGKWKGARELRYPSNFGRRSEKAIHWKGKDVKHSLKKNIEHTMKQASSKTSSKSKKSKSKTKSTDKITVASPGLFDRLFGEDTPPKRRTSSKKRSSAAKKIQAKQRGRNVRKTRKQSERRKSQRKKRTTELTRTESSPPL